MSNYKAPVRFNQNQLITPVVHNSASAPSVGVEVDGQLYYDTGTKLLCYWSVDRWISATGGGDGAYQQTIGDGTATQIDVVHNLGTTAVGIDLYSLPDLFKVETDVLILNANTVRFTFGTAPDTDSLHVLVFARAATVFGGGSGGGFTAVVATEDYSMMPGDYVLADCTNGDITIDLPNDPPNGTMSGIKKIDDSEYVVYLSVTAPATVDGDDAPTIETLGVSATFLYDGDDWHVVALVG